MSERFTFSIYFSESPTQTLCQTFVVLFFNQKLLLLIPLEFFTFMKLVKLLIHSAERTQTILLSYYHAKKFSKVTKTICSIHVQEFSKVTKKSHKPQQLLGADDAGVASRSSWQLQQNTGW